MVISQADSGGKTDPQLVVFVEFKDSVGEVRRALSQDPSQLPRLVEQLGAAYRSQVLRFDWDSKPVVQRSLIQSIQVEMHKQLRLLGTDLMFLKAAKQAEVQTKREAAIGDRLTNLQGYCDAILKLAQETTAGE